MSEGFFGSGTPARTLDQDPALGVDLSPRLSGIAARVGTPCFVYDAQVLRAAVAQMHAVLPPGARLAYAIKANPCKAVLAVFAGQGLGAEVASAGELRLAQAAGIEAGDIFFSGPAKTADDIHAAVHAGVGAIHVESTPELADISAMAQHLGRPARVALRIRFPAVQGTRRLGWGGASPFGMSPDEALTLARTIADFPGIDLIGLHNHQTVQALDPGVIEARIHTMAGFAAMFHTLHPLRYLNFGGGFGAPFYADDVPLSLGPVGAALAQVTGAALPDLGAGLVVEPGRYLVAAAGSYLVRVVRARDIDGQRFAFVDGGTHHAHLLSGTVRTMRRPVTVTCLRGTQADQVSFEVAGPLCTPVDRLASSALLPADLAPGDLLAFRNCGAYARYASPVAFLGHDIPAEVLIDGASEVVSSPRARIETVIDTGTETGALPGGVGR